MFSARTSPSPRKAGGVTLIELMVAIVVLAILISVAVPSFREVSLNNRSSGAINSLMADLALARSEALKLASTTSIAANGGNWSEGWEVFVDTNGDGIRQAEEELLKEAGLVNASYGGDNVFILRAVGGAATGSGAANRITFGSRGETRVPADGARFALCRPDRDAAKSTGIRIDLSGRAQSVRNLTALNLGCG